MLLGAAKGDEAFEDFLHGGGFRVGEGLGKSCRSSGTTCGVECLLGYADALGERLGPHLFGLALFRSNHAEFG